MKVVCLCILIFIYLLIGCIFARCLAEVIKEDDEIKPLDQKGRTRFVNFLFFGSILLWPVLFLVGFYHNTKHAILNGGKDNE